MAYMTNKNEQVLNEAHLKNSMRHQHQGEMELVPPLIALAPGSLAPGLPTSSEKPSGRARRRDLERRGWTLEGIAGSTKETEKKTRKRALLFDRSLSRVLALAVRVLVSCGRGGGRRLEGWVFEAEGERKSEMGHGVRRRKTWIKQGNKKSNLVLLQFLNRSICISNKFLKNLL